MKQYLFFAPLFIFVFGAIGVNLTTEEIQSLSPKVVDLSNRNLSGIPDHYKDQILEAEYLILDNNNISELPEWLKEAKNLTRLSLNNNPQFDFFRFCVEFQEMTQIENISASHCNIKMIPYQLTFFTKLKSLDLSHNKINHVPYHFSFLTYLENCDLSSNEITEVSMVFQDLQRLRNINISGNPDLNVKSFCGSLQYRELENLTIDFKDTIPTTFSSIKVSNLDLGINNNMVFNNQIRLNECSQLSVRSISPEELPSKLNQEISGMKNLKSLSFSNFIIQKWPNELKNLQTVHSLNISGTGLMSSDQLAGLPLKQLSILNNELNLEQIEKLKMEMPQCAIYSDEEKLKGKGISFSVNPPIKRLEPKAEMVTIDPKKPEVFTSKSGTTILNIPANAFLDAKGKVITTPVQISLTEYNDPVSVALSGIPMQIKNEDGTTGDFSSAGMFNLQASSNGVEVFPNPKALINATIVSPQTIPYNLYNFKEGSGWSLMQNQPVIPSNFTASISNDFINANPELDYSIYEELLRLKSSMGDTNSIRRCKVFEPKIGVVYKKSPSKQNFTISFKPLSMLNDFRRNDNSFNFHIAEEMRAVLETPLLYNDYDYANDVKLMDSIKTDIRTTYFPSKRDTRRKKKKRRDDYYWDENVVLKDISITPDKSKDDYVLKFNYRGRIHSFHVVLLDEGDSPFKIQKVNEKFMQNYAFADRKNKEGRDKVMQEYISYYEAEEKRVRENYKNKKAEFEKKKAEYDEQMKKNDYSFEQYEARKQKETQLAYSFQVASFGISNCDIVSRFVKPQPVKVKFKDVLGKALIFFRIIRIDKVQNMITYLEPRDQLIIDYSHDETSLIFMIDEETVGLVDAKSLFTNRDKSEMEVKIMPLTDLKPEKVRAML